MDVQSSCISLWTCTCGLSNDGTAPNTHDFLIATMNTMALSRTHQQLKTFKPCKAQPQTSRMDHESKFQKGFFCGMSDRSAVWYVATEKGVFSTTTVTVFLFKNCTEQKNQNPCCTILTLLFFYNSCIRVANIEGRPSVVTNIMVSCV